MIDHKQFLFLRERGLVPELHELGGRTVIPYSQFSALSGREQDKLRDKVAVVIDGALWAGSDPLIEGEGIPSYATIFSGDGVKVAKHIRGTKFGVYNVDEDRGLSVDDYIHLYTKQSHEEDQSMADEQQMGGVQGLEGLSVQDLERELGGGSPAAGGAAPAPMTSFDQGGAQAAGEGGGDTPLLNTGITDVLRNKQVANPFGLQMWNRAKGRLVGYVVNQDARIEFTTKSVPIVRDGMNVLIPSAPAHVKEQFTRGDKVAREYLQTEYTLGVRQTKPGKVVGMVLTIPVGGFIDLIKFREPGDLRADESKPELKTLLLAKDVYPSFLEFYYGKGIIEHEATHGGAEAAGEVHQVQNPRYKRVENSPTNKNVISRVLKTSKRKSLIIRSNYLPIKTYETIELGGNLTDEQIATLNTSSFYSLVNAKTPKNMTATKFELLSPEDKTKVQRGPNGITSRFFTNNASERVNIEVKPFYDKDADFLDKLEIPVKVERITKDTGNVTYRYVTYSTVDEKVINDPNLRNKASLYSGRFQAFLSAAGDAVNLDSLRDLVRRSTRGGAATASISNEDVIKMQLGLANHWIDEDILEFADKPEGGYSAITDKIYALQLAATN